MTWYLFLILGCGVLYVVFDNQSLGEKIGRLQRDLESGLDDLRRDFRKDLEVRKLDPSRDVDIERILNNLKH